MNKKKLIADLKQIGVRKGMDLCMHSSLARTGPVQGGPDAIIDGLLEAIGPKATLLMPTVSGTVTPLQPVFHVEKTPSSVGAFDQRLSAQKGCEAKPSPRSFGRRTRPQSGLLHPGTPHNEHALVPRKSVREVDAQQRLAPLSRRYPTGQ